LQIIIFIINSFLDSKELISKSLLNVNKMLIKPESLVDILNTTSCVLKNAKN
jgi:hypothetical protein